MDEEEEAEAEVETPRCPPRDKDGSICFFGKEEHLISSDKSCDSSIPRKDKKVAHDDPLSLSQFRQLKNGIKKLEDETSTENPGDLFEIDD